MLDRRRDLEPLSFLVSCPIGEVARTRLWPAWNCARIRRRARSFIALFQFIRHVSRRGIFFLHAWSSVAFARNVRLEDVPNFELHIVGSRETARERHSTLHLLSHCWVIKTGRQGVVVLSFR